MERVNQALDRMFPFDLKGRKLFIRNTEISTLVYLARPTPIRPVYLILQIHDELLFEIESNSRTNEIIQVIRREMERNEPINLILPVQIRSGVNWDSIASVVTSDA